MFNKHDIARDACQLFDLKGNLIDRVHAECVGCEYGEYSIKTPPPARPLS